ncbi:unnamed protein product [Lathyrus oleraceus]
MLRLWLVWRKVAADCWLLLLLFFLCRSWVVICITVSITWIVLVVVVLVMVAPIYIQQYHQANCKCRRNNTTPTSKLQQDETTAANTIITITAATNIQQL